MVAIDITHSKQASSYTTDNQGWMLQNTFTSQSKIEQLTKQVRSLFDSHHRCSSTRLRWVLLWTGITPHSSTIATSQEVETRIQFLKTVWSDEQFRPFDTIDSSVHYLQSNLEQDCLVRLSTTVPGCITISFRSQTQNTILHTRYFLNSKGNLKDSDGHEHTSCKSLLEWFAKKDYYKRPVRVAGYVQI